MTNDIDRRQHDWLASSRLSLLAWWIPQAAILAALLAPERTRAALWIVALTWMSLACIVNASRCGRTHCRYTGPFYLVMIAPTLALAAHALPAGPFSWLMLACVILLGSKMIWWVTERAWGKFS